MKYFRHRHAAAAVVLVAASLLAGCATPAPEETPAPEQPPPADPPYRPVASIREVMNSVIDPSVDVVWNSVGSVIDHGRVTDRAPDTDEDWAEVRRHALVVSEAANLLMMPNRPVAPPGAPSLAPGVELTPEEIRSLIDKNPAGWNFFAQQLQDSHEAGPGRDRCEGFAGAVRRRGEDRHDLRELPSGVLVSESRGIGSLTRIDDCDWRHSDEDEDSSRPARRWGALRPSSRHRRIMRSRRSTTTTKPVTLTGIVTKVEWVNPHGWIYMDAKQPDGNSQALDDRNLGSEPAVPPTG